MSPSQAGLIGRLSESRQLMAVRRGFLLLLPLVMLGALSLTLGNVALPWPAAAGFQRMFLQAGEAIFGVISLCLTLSVSYSLAASRQADALNDMPPLVPASVALLSFVMTVAPFDGSGGIGPYGTRSVFPALIVAILATGIFMKLLDRSRTRRGVLGGDADPALPAVLRALPPAFLTVACFLGVRQALGFAGQTPAAVIDTALIGAFGLLDSELARALLFNLLNHLLWFFGAHGNNVLAAIEHSYLDVAPLVDTAGAGGPIHPARVLTKTFLDVYVYMGGSGVSLGLLIALLLGWRGGNQRRLAVAGLFPALFNVSELVVFGLPIVLNPAFLVPFVLAPLVLVVTSYAACVAGWVPPVQEPLHWTTPVLLGGYLAAHSWRGVALQAANLLLTVLIYLPFVRAARRQAADASRRHFGALIKAIEEASLNQRAGVLERRDVVGAQARQLARALKDAIATGQLHLAYQPQVNAAGRVVGVEALLRWDYAPFGPVAPNVVVALAEEAGLVGELGDWVIRAACARMRQWREADCVPGVTMSINLSPTQLNHAGFAGRIHDILRTHGLSAEDIEFEITESRAVAHSERTAHTLDQLARRGIRLAIDDFGMGYSSLLYMRRFDIHAIKLDGSLTREILTNPSCREIVETIATLCRSKGIRIVAEFVETEEQLRVLRGLGCTEFQGYLFSRPLPPDACLEFIRGRNGPAPEQGDARPAEPEPAAALSPLHAVD